MERATSWIYVTSFAQEGHKLQLVPANKFGAHVTRQTNRCYLTWGLPKEVAGDVELLASNYHDFFPVQEQLGHNGGQSA